MNIWPNPNMVKYEKKTLKTATTSSQYKKREYDWICPRGLWSCNKKILTFISIPYVKQSGDPLGTFNLKNDGIHLTMALFITLTSSRWQTNHLGHITSSKRLRHCLELKHIKAVCVCAILVSNIKWQIEKSDVKMYIDCFIKCMCDIRLAAHDQQTVVVYLILFYRE